MDAIAETDGVEFVEHIAVPRDNEAQFIVTVKESVREIGDWEGVGFLQLSASSFPSLKKVLKDHPKALAGAFDLKSYIYDALEDKSLQFAIDQQPFLQGNLPVYLLTYMAYTQQNLANHLVQSGPSYVYELPSEAQKICEANDFSVCPDRPDEDMSYIPSSFLALGYSFVGLIVFVCLACVVWTYTSREMWVVRVSQPMFLRLVLLGAMVSSSSILFMGAQTSYRFARDSRGDVSEEANPEIAFVDAVSELENGNHLSFLFNSRCSH